MRTKRPGIPKRLGGPPGARCAHRCLTVAHVTWARFSWPRIPWGLSRSCVCCSTRNRLIKPRTARWRKIKARYFSVSFSLAARSLACPWNRGNGTGFLSLCGLFDALCRRATSLCNNAGRSLILAPAACRWRRTPCCDDVMNTKQLWSFIRRMITFLELLNFRSSQGFFLGRHFAGAFKIFTGRHWAYSALPAAIIPVWKFCHGSAIEMRNSLQSGPCSRHDTCWAPVNDDACDIVDARASDERGQADSRSAL